MYEIIKRIGDILMGIIGCILLIPISIYIIILKIIYKDKTKLIYSQYRIGKNGKVFKMYKYQTMVNNAEQILKEEMDKNPKIREEYEKNKKLEDDFRVTKVGKILRKNHIDEWPQFINVLLGNMSVVGPRPYMLQEKDEIEYYENITSVKPGITGVWQTEMTERNFKIRNELDLHHIQKQGILSDIKIILKTIKNLTGIKNIKTLVIKKMM